jgi:RNA polymerase sigma-70 factor (ECF subfamily)
MEAGSKPVPRQDSHFPSTHWSMVVAAQNQSTTEGAAALAALCRVYWRPLYAYVRRRGHAPEDAQDLTQGYFSRLLEKDYLSQADIQRGKFRSFLLASLKNFLANEWDRNTAQKRGGRIAFLSLEEMNGAEKHFLISSRDSLTPEKAYERSWVLTLLGRVTEQLRLEFFEAGKSNVFEQFKTFLTGDAGDETYSKIAATLGMSEVAARVAAHRLRGRFRDLLRAEIAQTLDHPEDPDAVEEEIRYLMSVL